MAMLHWYEVSLLANNFMSEMNVKVEDDYDYSTLIDQKYSRSRYSIAQAKKNRNTISINNPINDSSNINSPDGRRE